LTAPGPRGYSGVVDTLWIMLLGAVQGATEFLPVSSSGHLAVGQLIIAGGGHAVEIIDDSLLLEVLLHLATLLAVVAVYRREVVAVLKGAGRCLGALPTGRLGRLISNDDDANLALAIVVGSLPTAALGFALRKPASTIASSPDALVFCFLGCACLLLASRWWPGGRRRLSWRLALFIGTIQGVAVLPGISRSGVTIAVALALGLRREEAARFSFLLSVPAILGAAILEIDPAALTAGDHLGAYLLGASAAFAVGLGALLLLLRLVRGGRLWLFAPYLVAVAVFCAVFL